MLHQTNFVHLVPIIMQDKGVEFFQITETSNHNQKMDFSGLHILSRDHKEHVPRIKSSLPSFGSLFSTHFLRSHLGFVHHWGNGVKTDRSKPRDPQTLNQHLALWYKLNRILSYIHMCWTTRNRWTYRDIITSTQLLVSKMVVQVFALNYNSSNIPALWILYPCEKFVNLKSTFREQCPIHQQRYHKWPAGSYRRWSG